MSINRKLAAIIFTDIVNYTELSSNDNVINNDKIIFRSRDHLCLVSNKSINIMPS